MCNLAFPGFRKALFLPLNSALNFTPASSAFTDKKRRTH